MSKEEFPSEEDLSQDKTDKDQAEEVRDDSKKVDHSEDKKANISDKSNDVSDKISKLEDQIDELKNQNKDLEDKYLRSEAEIQNVQKRYNKERANLIKYESQNLGRDILSSVDNLERALQVKADDEVSKQLKKGIEMTLDGMIRALKDNGIEEIKAEGTKFDPTLHQAVQTVPAENDDQKDHVVQVLQKGYQYKDRTLRPAMVVVAQ